MSTKKALQFLNDQKLFYVLGSSKIKLGLSWKNKDQRYELECVYCRAIYSDSVTTNCFAGAKKGTTEDYTFLLCKNCGASQGTSDEPVKFKKTYNEYNVGPVPFPKKYFDVAKSYKGASEEVDAEIAALECYKDLPIDDTPEDEPCDCDLEDCENCNPPLGPIYLSVTDALIAAGLNPYDPNKRQGLVEFYASKRNATQHDYISFNKKHNGEKKKREKEVISTVDTSNLIKKIAENAQFGNSRDEYALEPIVNTLDALGVEVWENGTSLITIDERTGETVNITVENGTIVLTRKDGCVKMGIVTDDGIVQDETAEEVDFTDAMTEDEKKIFESYVNKKTGCCSEVNIHEYLKEIFDGYEHGQIPVNGVIDGVHYNGLIDGIVRAGSDDQDGRFNTGSASRPGMSAGKMGAFGQDSGGFRRSIIKPVVKGQRPLVIFEIKKRMKQIFSLEELTERKYDLCQMVLYKILTQQAATQGGSTKLVMVQSFGEDIEITRIPVETQLAILDQFRAGMASFKADIKKLKKL